MKTFVQQAKEIVQNHPSCKHLKELSFGCKVRIYDIDKEFTAIGKEYQGKKEEGANYWYFVNLAEREDPSNGVNLLSLKIIGHNPTLGDYLRVLGEINKAYEHKAHWHANTITVYAGTSKKINLNLIGEPLNEDNARLFVKLVTNK
jgi:hypothetical protein